MSSSRLKPRGLPAGPLTGRLRPPASKSVAQRALLAALLADGTTRLSGMGASSPLGDLPDACDDVRAALGVIRALGASVRGEGGVLVVEGVAGRPRNAPVAVGESGTLARLVTAIVAWCAEASDSAEPVLVEARGSLRTRQSSALLEALSASGVRIEFPHASAERTQGRPQDPQGDWPLEVFPRRPRGRALRIAKPGSSQEVSALLFCAAGLLTAESAEACSSPAGLADPSVSVEPMARQTGREAQASWRVRSKGPLPSRPYVDLTLHVLESFGVRSVEAFEGVDDYRWQLSGRLCTPSKPFEIEADASGAAVALAAAVLSGGRLAIEGIPADSAQGDVRILDHLRAFGCDAQREGEIMVAAGPPQRPAQLDLEREPDLAPVLAVVAAAAARASGGTSTLTGLGTLRGKESDRIAVLATGLRTCGYEVQAADDLLEIRPGTGAAVSPSSLDPAGDHRMAFAFALLGLLHPGVLVRDATCVDKSWPRFWEDLSERMG